MTTTTETNEFKSAYTGITKDQFKKFCKSAKAAFHMAQSVGFSRRFNEYLIMTYCQEIEKAKGRSLDIIACSPTVEFNTFKGWKEKGYKVKKGAKAYRVFAQPRKFKTEGETAKGEKLEKEIEFFPQACIFSENQVEAA